MFAAQYPRVASEVAKFNSSGGGSVPGMYPSGRQSHDQSTTCGLEVAAIIDSTTISYGLCPSVDTTEAALKGDAVKDRRIYWSNCRACFASGVLG